MINLIKADIKVLFRIPIALFFNVFFPIFISSVMISLVGNLDIGNGMNFADKYYLIGLSFALAPLTLISLPISISDMFNSGVLERYHLFGISIKKVLLSQIVVYFLLSIFEFSLLTIYLYIFFNVTFNVMQLLLVLSIYILVDISMIMLGLFLGMILPNKETAQSIGLILMFLSLMLVGGFGDISNLPIIFTNTSKLTPLYILSQDLLNVLLSGDSFSGISVAVPFIYIFVFLIIDITLVNVKFKKI